MSADKPLHDLQQRILRFAEERDWARFHSPRNLAMALSVEANELLELYLWSADDGPQPLNPERRKQVEEEAADVLFCLLNFCARAEVDLDEAFERMVEKAERKYPADRVRGKALKYNEYDEWSPTADAPPADEG